MQAKGPTSLGSRFSKNLLARLVRGLTLTSSLFRFTIPVFNLCAATRISNHQLPPNGRRWAWSLKISQALHTSNSRSFSRLIDPSPSPLEMQKICVAESILLQ